MTTTGASLNTEAEPPEPRQAPTMAPARTTVSAARRMPSAILPLARGPSRGRAERRFAGERASCDSHPGHGVAGLVSSPAATVALNGRPRPPPVDGGPQRPLVRAA